MTSPCPASSKDYVGKRCGKPATVWVKYEQRNLCVDCAKDWGIENDSINDLQPVRDDATSSNSFASVELF